MKPVKPEPASPGYRRHAAPVQYAISSGAFMPLRGIQGLAAHCSPAICTSQANVRFVPEADVIILDLSMRLVAFDCVKKLFQESYI